VMECVEALAPGLYAMNITELPADKGAPRYEVSFEERRLEELTRRINKFQRADEKPFEAVAAVSEFNQRAYELFAQPLVQALSNDTLGQLQRTFHPLRLQRWALSDLNPATWWLRPAAEMARQHRRPLDPAHPLRQGERLTAELASAATDAYRAVRDALSEAQFFQLYGHLFSLYLADRPDAARKAPAAEDLRDLPVVQEALAAIDRGGYAEAAARAAFLLARKGQPLPLERLQLKKDLIDEAKDLLPDMPMDEARRVRGEQELIVRYAPEEAVLTLPHLLPRQADRDRLLQLLDRVLADPRVRQLEPLPEQVAMLDRIRDTIGASTPATGANGSPAPMPAPKARRLPARAERKAAR